MATIKDIAQRVNVSPTTVSRVLNSDPTLSVSRRIRLQVVEVAAELNYATPRSKRGIKEKLKIKETRIKNILILLSTTSDYDVADPFYIGLRMAIENYCKELGLPVSVHHPQDTDIREQKVTPSTGIIVIGKQDKGLLETLATQTQAMVFLAPHAIIRDCDIVTHDLESAMRNVLDMLSESNCKRIGYLGGLHDGYLYEGVGSEQRARAFRQWHKEQGMLDEELIKEVGRSSEDGHRLTNELLAYEPELDAIVAGNDSLAIGAYTAIKQAGKRIPEDISVVGFNDIPAAQYVEPSLTTVKLPVDLVGKTGIDFLLERGADRRVSKKLIFGAEILKRGSTKP